MKKPRGLFLWAEHQLRMVFAGVKIEEGYEVYEEGVAGNYFVKCEDGSDFEACVWPGMTHLPDVLNKEAREWFGSKYGVLISKGIDAFWNDMNEPAIFYSKEGREKTEQFMREYLEGKHPEIPYQDIGGMFLSLANNEDDYASFYHNVDGQKIRHDRVHNLYGYNMTRAAGEAFEKISPDKTLSVFTPLFRNHSALGTREQEFYQFENTEDFRAIIEARYRLIPYIYSEYMKAVRDNEMLFKPLAFDYPEDEHALGVEDQLIMGNEIMIAPVYTQNADGRYVYLPENMLFVKLLPNGRETTEELKAGHHYVKVGLNEIPFFIKKDKKVPLAAPALRTSNIDYASIKYVGHKNVAYELYEDDGISRTNMVE